MTPFSPVAYFVLTPLIAILVIVAILAVGEWASEGVDRAVTAALSDLDDPCETYEAAHGWIPADTWEHFEAWERQMRPYDWREAGL